MTMLAFAAIAAIMMGQQPAPLVSQKELPPPAAVQPQAPLAPAAPQTAPPTVPQAPQGQFAQQQQPPAPAPQPPAGPAFAPQAAPLAAPQVPVRPARAQEAAQRSDNKAGGGKRVIAFWVILPDSNK